MSAAIRRRDRARVEPALRRAVRCSVIRVDPSGGREAIVTGLTFACAITCALRESGEHPECVFEVRGWEHDTVRVKGGRPCASS